jgi:hypothetical protein
MEMPTAANITKADHEILVSLQQGSVVAHNLSAPLKLGETVHCSSKDGEVEIYFDVDGTPFRNQNGSLKTEIDSNDPPLELKARGTFTGRCYIIPPGGSPIGYNGAGGNMDVR